MTKPTLFQSILGRPSQSYSFPASKEYHSAKHDLLRAATQQPRSPDDPHLRTRSIVSAPDAESGYFSSSSTSSQHSKDRTNSDVASSDRRSRLLRDTEDDSMSQTKSSRRQSQDRSQPKSIASSQAITEANTEPTFSTISASTPRTSFYSNTTPKPSPHPSLHPSSFAYDKHSPEHACQGSEASGSVTDGSSDDEVFYTPRQSFYGSPRTSRTSTGMIIDPKAIAQALSNSSLPKVLSRSSLKSKEQSNRASNVEDSPDRTSSESLLSTTSSSSGGGTIGTIDSEQSFVSRATTSTRITTPLMSDRGSAQQKETVETITIARSQTRSQSSSSVPSTAYLSPSPPPSARGQPRPLSATRRRSKTELRRASYTDEDWAKEVRWLAPAISAQMDSPRKPVRHLPPAYEFGVLSSTPTSITPSKPLQQGGRSYPPPAKSSEHRRRSRRSRGSRSSRGRMSALLEEDESEYSDMTPTGSSAEPSRAPSPVPEERQEYTLSESPREMATSPSPLGTTASRSRSYKSAKEPSVSSSDEAAENPDARLKAYAYSKITGQPRRSYSHTRRLSRSISPGLFSFSQNLPTHSIPTPTPVAAEPSAPQGYTGLTLPRAAYTGNGKAETGDGKVDLVRMGLAQSSMATVEVTRGAAEQNGGDARKKRRHFSFQLPLKLTIGKGKGKGKEASTPSHLLDSLPLPVAFLSHIPPPSYIPSSYVLVQVFAVGLDSLDSLTVHEKMANGGKGLGFVPGRSIVGKVVECGWEVKGDVCRKNDWIIGLLDVRKCGALAEFLVLERHRVHRAPQPLSRPTTLFPQQRRSHVRSKSLPSQMSSHPYAQLHRDLISSMNMTIEELALLPLCALPAHRAIRTCADVIAPAKPRPDVEDGHSKKPRAIVLQGHDGTGALAVQMLAKRGVNVVVQVPDSAARDDTNEDDGEDTDGSLVNVRQSPPTDTLMKTRFDRLEARLRAWGAEEICVGSPLEVLERLHEDCRSFDVVLDTVGGTEVWEISKKLLLANPENDATRNPSLNNLGTPSTTSGAPSSGLSRASSRANHKTLALTQFTTLVGDTPSRPVPTAQDTLRSGFRSVRRSASSRSTSRDRNGSASPTKSSTSLALTSPSKDSLGSVLRRGNSWRGRTKAPKRTVNYAWVSVAADVDFEGEDVRDSLGAVVKMVEEGWIKPWVGDNEGEGSKSVPFDKAPEVFRRGADGPVGLLKDGGTCVVRIVA